MSVPPGDDAKDPAPGPEPLAEWQAEDAELLRNLFLGEAEDHVRRMTDAQQVLARRGRPPTPDDAGPIDLLFRHLHSLKGAAGSVGFDAIARAAHELEELCAEIRAGHLAATPGILERIDEGIEGLRAMLDGARAAPARAPSQPGAPPASPTPGRRASDRRVMDRRGAERTLRVDSDRLDALLDGVGDLVILRTRMGRWLRELEGVLRDLGVTRTSLRSALGTLGAEVLPGTAPTSPGHGRTARMLDRLAEVEVEFTDAISYLERATKALGGESESLRKTTDHLEEQISHARLVPLDWLFARLAAALRELERTAERNADLSLEGGEIEIDKSVVEQLTDPLLHLLRNAVAHGIESADERVARGKPPRGRIRVAARQDNDLVSLVFEDDGAGLDRARIREALVRAGRLAPDLPLPEDLMMSAIFEPGFTSRERSDALAGRGMGLNIVQRALVQLGGEVSVDDAPGSFTRFRMVVPLTAMITQALLFKVGGQVYAVPASHVLEALPCGLDEPALDATGSIPLLRLQPLFGVEIPPGRRGIALSMRYGSRRFAITCDRVIGPRTIVVRPVGPLLDGLSLYGGVTISGAGKAQLVLDLATLAELAHTPVKPAGAPLRRGHPRVLVVDDSRLSREAAARMLASSGYHPITAEDGWEAWEMLGERRFDAVVTDLEMPRIDGFELIARIRREPTLRGLPVVVLSSRTSRASRERALAAGANAVLPKGPSKRGLSEALAALVEDDAARDRMSS